MTASANDKSIPVVEPVTLLAVMPFERDQAADEAVGEAIVARLNRLQCDWEAGAVEREMRTAEINEWWRTQAFRGWGLPWEKL